MSDGKLDFSSYLSSRNIICHTSAGSKHEVIRALASALAGESGLDIGVILRQVAEREERFPTLIAKGVAMPHARLNGLQRPVGAIATSKPGIRFGVEELDPAHLIVLLLTPGDDPALHLQILSALAGAFKDGVERLCEQETPQDMLRCLKGAAEVPDYLRVRDIMRTGVVTVREQDDLKAVIGAFAASGADELPVLDSEGDLRGIISHGDLLRHSLPEHLLWMEDLSPIYRFQPFAEMLSNAGDIKAGDVMRDLDKVVRVSMDVPAVQLAKLFLMENVNTLLVVDVTGKFAGMVTVGDLSARLFWE